MNEIDWRMRIIKSWEGKWWRSCFDMKRNNLKKDKWRINYKLLVKWENERHFKRGTKEVICWRIIKTVRRMEGVVGKSKYNLKKKIIAIKVY